MTGRLAKWMVGAGIALAAPALAQPSTMSENEAFLKAVRDQDGNKVIDLANSKGRSAINYRGYDGTTALTIAMAKRASIYVNYFIQNGADPDLGNRDGDTALIIAARSGYMEGLETMLRAGARVDATNRKGETALILAVQNRQLGAVRRLLEKGADANRTDHAAGYSARDYAKRDTRASEILRLIDSIKPATKKASGPVIN